MKQSQRITTYGSALSSPIIIISIFVSLVMLVYYGLYQLFSFVVSSPVSILITTGIYAIIFVAAYLYKKKHGSILPETYTEQPQEENIPEIPDIMSEEEREQAQLSNRNSITDVESEETESESESETTTKTTSQSSSNEYTQDSDISSQQKSRELYMKALQDDSYSIEDARRDINESSSADEDEHTDDSE